MLGAFKTETPALFGPEGFVKDFNSNTAVLGDKVTAHISHVPTTGAYDPNNGGYKAAAQDVTTLIEDVPVTLNQLRLVTVKLSYLTQIASKVELYKAAIANMGFSLGRFVVDNVLSAAMTNVSNSVLVSAAAFNLDTFEGIRDQCNAQKMAKAGRSVFLNTRLAGGLGADDRVRSDLYYGQKNGEQGYRVWKNLSGFGVVTEYPDFQVNGNIAGLALEPRLAAVSVRKLQDMNETAKLAGAPKVMDFYPVSDPESKVELSGVSWQESGTGDVYLAVAILFGVSVGNQGGAVGSVTDNAGCLIRTI